MNAAEWLALTYFAGLSATMLIVAGELRGFRALAGEYSGPIAITAFFLAVIFWPVTAIVVGVQWTIEGGNDEQ